VAGWKNVEGETTGGTQWKNYRVDYNKGRQDSIARIA